MREKINIKFLILFLMLSQFVTLSHAIEHQIVHEHSEQCLVCIHANDNNVITCSPYLVDSAQKNIEKVFYSHIFYDLKTISFQNIRSPPIHP
jgi:hypothetical protein